MRGGRVKGQANTALRKISDENVHYILTAHPMSRPADLAAEVGTNEQTVRDIRANKMYRDMFPEIERVPCWSRRGGCASCRHFEKQEVRGVVFGSRTKERTKSRCGFDFPEFTESSTNAGHLCNWFEPR